MRHQSRSLQKVPGKRDAYHRRKRLEAHRNGRVPVLLQRRCVQNYQGRKDRRVAVVQPHERFAPENGSEASTTSNTKKVNKVTVLGIKVG